VRSFDLIASRLSNQQIACYIVANTICRVNIRLERFCSTASRTLISKSLPIDRAKSYISGRNASISHILDLARNQYLRRMKEEISMNDPSPGEQEWFKFATRIIRLSCKSRHVGQCVSLVMRNEPIKSRMRRMRDSVAARFRRNLRQIGKFLCGKGRVSILFKDSEEPFETV